MNRDRNLNCFTPTPQSAVMNEAQYPVTPTKPRENQNRQSYMGSFSSTPQGYANSTGSATPSSTGIDAHLRYGGAASTTQNFKVEKILGFNKVLQNENKKRRLRNKSLHEENNALKARIDELTAALANKNTENTPYDETYKDIVFKIFAAYASGQELNSDDLTSKSVQDILNTVYFEAKASKHLRAQLEVLEAKTEALEKDLVTSRSQCQSLKERQFDQDAKLQISLHNLELCQDEARGLQTQVRALQKEMLAQVSNNETITDEMFSRDFHALTSLVKSLSRSVQPAQNVDILEALKPNVLLRGVSKHHWDTRARKKAYVEAWIWSVLISAVFQFSFGFCEDSITLHETWCFVFGQNWFVDWPEPTVESEAWRFTTVSKLVEDIGRETLITGQDHGDQPGMNTRNHCLQMQVLKRRTSIAQMIKSPLTAVAPTSDLSHISDIVNKAFALALNMSSQRFRVQVTWPKIGDSFKANQMTPVPDRNGEDIRGGVVAFIVNPGLTRWGNTHGQNFDICHQIVPSLVQLEPVQTKRRASHVLVSVKREPGLA